MVLAIVVSESHEDRGIWEVLSEQFLCLSMSFQQKRVVHFDLSSRGSYFLRNLMSYDIAIEGNEIDMLS